MKSLKTLGIYIFAAVLWTFTGAVNASSAEDESAKKEETVKFNWVKGPAKCDLGKMAGVKLPTGYLFLDASDTKKIMTMMGNRPSDNELGFIQENSEKSDWFVIFMFDAMGYVSDTNQDLDEKKLLKEIKEGNEEGNKWRRENGFAELKVIDWKVKPYYNKETKNLEWALLNESNNGKNINYTIKILGRSGVMEAVVVCGPEQIDAVIPKVRMLLEGYSYTSGNKYSEYVKGDKVAKYGLAALITGGAAVAAVKSGLLVKFWKFILIGLAAVAAYSKKIYYAIFKKKDNENQ
jgi:uncharacterized membrane-anchored protein